MVEEQIAWEEECVKRGSARYVNNQERLKDNKQAEQTDAIKYLMQRRLRRIAQRIEHLAYKKKGSCGVYNTMLRNITLDKDYLKLAYMGAQSAFQAMSQRRPATLLHVVLSIAKKVEADLKCTLFEAEYPGYYHTVNKSFSDSRVSGYEHKHNVLMTKFKHFDLNWEEWTPSAKVQMGGKILQCVMAEFYDVLYISKKSNGSKTTSMLEATMEFDKWMKEFQKERGFLLPELLPLKIPPIPWTGLTEGGYYTPRMRAALPFIKTKSSEHKNHVLANMPTKHLEGVNKIQATAWQINTKVLDVQRKVYQQDLGIGVPASQTTVVPDFPEHLKTDKDKYTKQQIQDLAEWKSIAKRTYLDEQTRKGQLLAFMQAQKLADELKDWDKFYFAFNCDFRGRVYCATAGLSPQGSDNAKGLLTFKEEVTLGESGLYWLAVHGANTFGNDKGSYEERIQWIKDHKDQWKAAVENPIDNREIWASADKPYQFLAFLFDWAKCGYGTLPNTTSNLPVGLDGSCNGLQHFSALLRDGVGASATNLSSTETPQDIYQKVADRCIERLSQLDSRYARKLIKVGITRKCTKRPVMTLPYGATQQSARHYIMEYLVDNWDKFNLPERFQWEFAKFLTPILWASIGDVVIAARTCMKWLQQNIGKGMVHWKTPIGFPVYQCYKDVPATRVKTQICGEITLFYRDLNKEGTPHRYLQRSGIAPNFVHSLDSTHMIMTLIESDLTNFSMIHDDFGTHAGNAENLQTSIRKAFFKMYSECCPLTEWAEQMNVDIETLPEKYDYNLSDIFRADYFFG